MAVVATRVVAKHESPYKVANWCRNKIVQVSARPGNIKTSLISPKVLKTASAHVYYHTIHFNGTAGDSRQLFLVVPITRTNAATTAIHFTMRCGWTDCLTVKQITEITGHIN